MTGNAGYHNHLVSLYLKLERGKTNCYRLQIATHCFFQLRSLSCLCAQSVSSASSGEGKHFPLFLLWFVSTEAEGAVKHGIGPAVNKTSLQTMILNVPPTPEELPPNGSKKKSSLFAQLAFRRQTCSV